MRSKCVWVDEKAEEDSDESGVAWLKDRKEQRESQKGEKRVSVLQGVPRSWRGDPLELFSSAGDVQHVDSIRSYAGDDSIFISDGSDIYASGLALDPSVPDHTRSGSPWNDPRNDADFNGRPSTPLIDMLPPIRAMGPDGRREICAFWYVARLLFFPPTIT
jgi:hypothetical protein